MNNHQNYATGHCVHLIQARKALENSTQWRRATVIEIEEGVITLQLLGDDVIYKCNDTTQLRDLFDTGRIPLNSEGQSHAI